MRMGNVGFPVEMIEDVPVVTAPEEIDITNAGQLRAALRQAALRQAGGSLVVDMTRTRFCDSAAIQALVGAHKRARAEGGRVLLAVSGEAVPRIFEITGIDQVLSRFGSVAEALAQVTAAVTPPGGISRLGG
jgi:anti-sigma B factor antagonist